MTLLRVGWGRPQPNGDFEMETGGAGEAQKWVDLLCSMIAEVKGELTTSLT